MAIKFQYNKTSLQQLEKQLKVRVTRIHGEVGIMLDGMKMNVSKPK